MGVIGSGHVFADLGLPDPEAHLATANAVIEITDVMEKRRLTHTRAARLMGISRPELTELLPGRTRGYTVDF
ncbi:XRE family transcriptional regulator [Bradyrhizobium sp. I71]|nr:XRE family transcriptional regulator [Bradyrhizobium sp. I71]